MGQPLVSAPGDTVENLSVPHGVPVLSSHLQSLQVPPGLEARRKAWKVTCPTVPLGLGDPNSEWHICHHSPAQPMTPRTVLLPTRRQAV